MRTRIHLICIGVLSQIFLISQGNFIDSFIDRSKSLRQVEEDDEYFHIPKTLYNMTPLSGAGLGCTYSASSEWDAEHRAERASLHFTG